MVFIVTMQIFNKYLLIIIAYYYPQATKNVFQETVACLCECMSDLCVVAITKMVNLIFKHYLFSFLCISIESRKKFCLVSKC